MNKVTGEPVEIEFRRETETQSAGEIVAIGSPSRPLPLQAIFEFSYAARRGVGSAGNSWPARYGNEVSIGAGRFAGIGTARLLRR